MNSIPACLIILAIFLQSGCRGHGGTKSIPLSRSDIIPNIEKQHYLGPKEIPYIDMLGFGSHYELKVYLEWAQQHHLNMYGDPLGTRYPYSSPLYNPKKHLSLHVLDYALRKHPDRPWLNNSP